MSDIAIRVENCVLSRVEGLGNLYRIGRNCSLGQNVFRQRRSDRQ